MAEMGRYCKAYHVKQLRAFAGWKENLANLRKEKKVENGEEVEIERTALGDEDIVYIQENYVVTDGIFKDENVIFDAVTDAWREFCERSLEFRIPAHVREGVEEKT